MLLVLPPLPLLGAVGVIASLVYLAMQTRQNSFAVRTSNYIQRNTQMCGFVGALVLQRAFYPQVSV